MKTLLLALTLMISTVSFAGYYEDQQQQQKQCNTYCTDIAGSQTCQTVCS